MNRVDPPVRETIVLDLGSHSAKAYLRSDAVHEIATVTWSLLDQSYSLPVIESTLREMVAPLRRPNRDIVAVGTEAMRRNRSLAEAMGQVCLSLGIGYSTLSQEQEATLIIKAFRGHTGLNIINAGGGSIQIVSAASGRIDLLPFGISDLNRQFHLAGVPADRQIDACIAMLASHLPTMDAEFIYTGGEAKYLRYLGVALAGGKCTRSDFARLCERLARLEVAELEALSPYDPKWMRGAIASNCIVVACLNQSGADAFTPSDRNIAHGLMSELA